jgi:hypothetical protein
VERPTSNSFIFCCVFDERRRRYAPTQKAEQNFICQYRVTSVSMMVRQWSQRNETGATFFRRPNPNGAESIRLTAITFQFASKQSQTTRLLSRLAIPR